MTLPSIRAIAQEKGLNLACLTEDQQEELLVEAMRRDLPLAVKYLHGKAHEDGPNAGQWHEDPNSLLGRQLIRIHASDALRPLASRHFCHGKELTFVNCCGGVVGGEKKTPGQLMELQIAMQDGRIASADC